jgi:hypothetical protein
VIARRALALTGVIAATLSIGAFAGVLALGGSPQIATLLRLAISAPILVVGMRGLGDPLRVGLAVGTSTGVKLALEPLLATVLLAHDPRAAMLAPLIGDLGYGPIILFAMLRRIHHRAFAIA